MFNFIFGLGLGKMQVNLEKYNFVEGETIKGKISFNLKKPTQARAVKVGIYAKQKQRTRRPASTNRNVGPSTTTETITVYDFDQQLDGEKEYMNGDYPFEIKVPTGVLAARPQAPDGALGTVVKTLAYLGPQKRYPIQWELKAWLDIPMKFDVSKKVQIQVTEGAAPAQSTQQPPAGQPPPKNPQGESLV